MTALARPIIASFQTANDTLSLQLSDLSNQDAVRRARGDSGASISWIIGHLLDFRCAVLAACGVDCPNPYSEKFSFQSPATDGRDYPDIRELWSQWRGIHEKLLGVLSGLTEEQLNGETALPSTDPTRSLLGALGFYAWHEAYHVGAVGTLRVAWGYRHTHELAMERMKQGQ